jgi:hypothetical protein
MEHDAAEATVLESVSLPGGVTARQWGDEKARWQNPRIRALLGCATILETVYESNQAILSCSPERLAEIWETARRVAVFVSSEVMPLLEGSSLIPKLEEARLRTRAAARVLDTTVIDEIERMPERVEEERSRDFRRLLCIALGQLHDFLQDAFSDLMANDPRSFHDPEYFLSRRFRRDVEEAEWLLTTVDSLVVRLDALEPGRERDLGAFLSRSMPGDALPVEKVRRAVSGFLCELVEGFTPRLKEVASLRGIRFAELEVIDRWASDLPLRCHLVLELWEVARRGGVSLGEEEGRWARVIQSRARELLVDLDGLLKDLRAFLPLWRRGIANRRALVFRRAEPDGPGC